MSEKHLNNLKYSVLDLATVAEGRTIANTFAHSLELAQQAEKLGYERFWLAEHHNMIAVASSATSVLIGYIAGGTQHIRVGSGGIMLPNHAPLIVAEQFGTLETLYPGRIDLGLGRAPGSDQLTSMAIRGERFHAAHNFPKEVQQLLTYFSPENCHANVRAIPGEGCDIPIWILGSSLDSARLAAAMGLPYAFASHFAPAQFLNAINLYRQNFQPSVYLREPYVMACVNAVVADSDQEAARLFSSLQQMFLGIVTGKRKLLQPPVADINQIWEVYEEEAVNQMLAISFIGGVEKVQKELSNFVEQTQIDELMVTSHIYDHEARLHSYKLLADLIKSSH